MSLRGIIDSPGFKLLPPVPQASLRWAVTCVTAIEAGTVEQLKLKSLSADALLIWHACWNFVQFAGSLDGKQGSKLHSGAFACVAMLQHCLAATDKAALGPQVALLEKFSWLVPMHRATDLGKCLKMCSVPKAKAKAKA